MVNSCASFSLFETFVMRLGYEMEKILKKIKKDCIREFFQLESSILKHLLRVSNEEEEIGS